MDPAPPPFPPNPPPPELGGGLSNIACVGVSIYPFRGWLRYQIVLGMFRFLLTSCEQEPRIKNESTFTMLLSPAPFGMSLIDFGMMV